MDLYEHRVRLCMPTAVTVLSLCLISWAIILVLRGDFYCSFGFALLAFVTDTLDGFIARRIGSETKIGAVLDSVGDVFIYLVYPAVAFTYYFGLNSPTSLFVISVFFSAGLYRLVRFTNRGFSIKNGVIGYSGVPVVFSHVLVLCFVLLKVLNVPYFELLAGVSLLILSVLMVQNFYFPKPKQIATLAVTIVLLSMFFFSLCLV